jgi:hypothetical protein
VISKTGPSAFSIGASLINFIISGLPQHVNLATLYIGNSRVRHFVSFCVVAHEGILLYRVTVLKTLGVALAGRARAVRLAAFCRWRKENVSI